MEDNVKKYVVGDNFMCPGCKIALKVKYTIDLSHEPLELGQTMMINDKSELLEIIDCSVWWDGLEYA